MLACRSTISVFIYISLLSRAWHYFALTIAIVVTHFTHMHVLPFSESCIHCFHAWSFTLSYTQSHHASKPFHVFSRLSTGLGCLGLNIALPRKLCTFLEVKALPSLQKLHKFGQHWPPSLHYTILGGSIMLTLENCAMQSLGMHALVDWNCTLRSFSA